eukprot:SAG31_NODE_210_length_20286_cov_22.684748_5_plen_89_part_00
MAVHEHALPMRAGAHRGASSPAKPALHMPEPLSSTIAWISSSAIADAVPAAVWWWWPRALSVLMGADGAVGGGLVDVLLACVLGVGQA